MNVFHFIPTKPDEHGRFGFKKVFDKDLSPAEREYVDTVKDLDWRDPEDIQRARDAACALVNKEKVHAH